MPDGSGRISGIDVSKIDWVVQHLGVQRVPANQAAQAAGPAVAEPSPETLDADRLRGFALQFVGTCWGAMAQETKANYNNLNQRLRGGDKMPAWAGLDDPILLGIANTHIAEAGLQPGVTQADATVEFENRKKKIDDALTKAAMGAINIKIDNITVDERACKEIFKECGYSWKKIKARYMNDAATMWEMFQFRKRWVNGKLAILNAQFGGELVAKSVGSNNLSSDYDITLSTKTGSGMEIEAIKAFNTACKAEFGVPPGFCFDTNLYAKDFLKVADNLLAGPGEKVSDEGTIAEVEEFLAEDQSDQDVGALTKQRQYLGLEDWEDYKNGILAAIHDEKQQKAASVQFEEAEALYVQKVKAKTDPLIAVLQGLLRKWDEADEGAEVEGEELEDLKEELDSLIARYQVVSSDVRESASLDRVADEIAHFAHEHAEADMLETNNAVYLEKMEGVRKVQAEHKAVDGALAQMGQIGKPAFAEAVKKMPKKDQDEIVKIAQSRVPDAAAQMKAYLEGRSHGLKARAKKDVAEANFFASEAYLSEGPLQHIVAAIQSGSPEVLAKMKPEHFLGSINEQFGDFMKDIGHYAEAGEAFCQTSKYIERLLDGIALLRGKDAFKDVAIGVMPAGDLTTMKGNIQKQLLPIRGSKGAYAEMSDADRFAAALTEAGKVYGFEDKNRLTGMLKNLTKQVNADVRSIMSMRPDAAAIGAYAQKSGAAA